jgi:peptide chain release factor 1
MKFVNHDFEIQWFSGTGAGGQHRNKTQNCCRVIHTPTGIKAQGTNSRSREANLRNAMAVCQSRVVEHFRQDIERYRATNERVRTYHEPDNRVTDHASGEQDTYKNVVIDGDGSKMIEARAQIMRVRE